ncbi:MAG: SGNH/GDSL hydrolase family protein [Thermoanaerobaculia bacterium]|nr:SGNH/GDSL hydrolase family protein [Thermoanaerobaculia bacterium]
MARFLALGDSYTIGESVEPSERWPARLAELLRAEGLEVADPEIVAKTGWTTEELDAAIEATKPAGPFDLVSLLVGVNDQYRGLEIFGFRDRFASLLQRAIAFAGGASSRVLVLSIPDWGVTPFARDKGRDLSVVRDEIDDFNAIVRVETARAGSRFVDVTPISRLASHDPSMLAADRLHPSAAMYRLWAKLALEQARTAIGRVSRP